IAARIDSQTTRTVGSVDVLAGSEPSRRTTGRCSSSATRPCTPPGATAGHPRRSSASDGDADGPSDAGTANALTPNEAATLSAHSAVTVIPSDYTDEPLRRVARSDTVAGRRRPIGGPAPDRPRAPTIRPRARAHVEGAASSDRAPRRARMRPPLRAGDRAPRGGPGRG